MMGGCHFAVRGSGSPDHVPRWNAAGRRRERRRHGVLPGAEGRGEHELGEFGYRRAAKGAHEPTALLRPLPSTPMWKPRG